MGTEAHRFSFFRSGGVDQVLLRSGADIIHLDQLDPKLWVALAMPVRGLDFDPRTLELLDTDRDGRIRAPEVLEAVRLVGSSLRDPDILLAGTDGMRLQDLVEGPLAETARSCLAAVKKPLVDEIRLADVEAAVKGLAAARLNGDGVVPPESAMDERTRLVLADIVSCLGGVPDNSGKAGVDRAGLDTFYTQAVALRDWRARGLTERDLQPIGEGTGAACAAWLAVRDKVEDYFLRCRLAGFDPRAGVLLNGAEDALRVLGAELLGPASAGVRALPLARIEAGRPLPLEQGLNPAWTSAMAELAAKAIRPLLGPGVRELDEESWRRLCTRLAPFQAYLATKPGTKLEGLPADRLQALFAPGVREALEELIAEDARRAGDAERLTTLEKLLRSKRDLVRLLSNFVNFGDFYGKRPAVFQAGTLYLDGKSMSLCLEVTDTGKHASMAPMASTFLLYCDCTRPGEQKRTIAAALTEGNPDNLLVGRNGVFYDRQGRDWDATVTRMVAQPISLRQAFWAPYKKLARMIEEFAAKRAAAAEEQSQSKLGGAAEQVAYADKTKAPEKGKPASKIDVGTVAAIGVAIGGLGAMVTGILSAFLDLGLWMPVGFLALLFMFSGPSMVLAYQKLRQRNLGPVLDANGWAINVPVRINLPFGRALTSVATRPAGAGRPARDPFAEKKRSWWLYLSMLCLLALAALWYLGKLDSFLPEVVRSTAILGKNAPAASPNAVPPTPPPVPPEG